ncbi:hypothetical protein CSKR_109832 [Clonorchis sinensis]|uniref:Uncharacterized protein n=1 Tax=Clonorchis sinensis TaxID=79923 RepID=A0A3R7CNP6_CLOSI|nr:hypothetical protein CSKR_109832 [Clonorchis sinensis]
MLSDNTKIYLLVSTNTFICISIWFSRLTQLNLSLMVFFNCMCQTKAASCSSCYDIRNIAIHVYAYCTTHKVAENSSTARDRFCPSSGSSGRRDSTEFIVCDILRLSLLHKGCLMFRLETNGSLVYDILQLNVLRKGYLIF